MNYAAGKVCVGFSYPVVAKYAANGGEVTLSEGRVLARGVSVDVSINTQDSTDFYADDVLAESSGERFKDGSLKLTVDGLFAEAERFISGQPAAVEVPFGDSQVSLTKHSTKTDAPYVAVGVIAKYMSGGVELWTPYIFPKTKFKPTGLKAQTKGESISYQTQDLEAALHREDTPGANWKWVGEDFTTEAEARAVLNTVCAVAGA